MRKHRLAWLLCMMILAPAASLAGCGNPQPELTPVVPETYETYWSELLGIAFEGPPDIGIAEYPGYGGILISGPGEWAIRGLVVNQRNEGNVAEGFDYLYGMRPGDLLDALQDTSGFGQADGEYQALPALEGVAQYVHLTDSAAGYLVVGAVGTPEHLILLTGQASSGDEEAMMEIFLNVLATARFAVEPSAESESGEP